MIYIDPYRYAAASPLDALSPGAAWSVARRVRTAYGGSLIRIRRSSDNAEQDIGVDGSGNLDTSAVTSFVGANSAYVTTIYDQSGNSRNFTQTTAGAQPLICHSSGVIATRNSRPCAEFDGATQWMSNSADVFGEFNNGDIEWFHIAETAIGRGNSGTNWSINFVPSDTCAMVLVTSGAVGYSVTPSLSGVFGCYHYRIDQTGTGATPTSHYTRRNGVAVGSVTGIGNASLRGGISPPWQVLGRLFATTYYGGCFIESVAFHSSLLADAVRDEIEADQVAYYMNGWNPGAAAAGALDSWLTSMEGAFSLRKLVGSYAGPAVRVRRSSDDALLDIGFAADGSSIDTTALAAFVGANSAYVHTWYDQYGSMHLRNLTNAEQPQIVSSGTYLAKVQFTASTSMKLVSLGAIAPTTKKTIMFRGALGATASLQGFETLNTLGGGATVIRTLKDAGAYQNLFCGGGQHAVNGGYADPASGMIRVDTTGATGASNQIKLRENAVNRSTFYTAGSVAVNTTIGNGALVLGSRVSVANSSNACWYFSFVMYSTITHSDADGDTINALIDET